MSAILSSDDLNDFISPGVACIKPLEALPEQREEPSSNPYEVTTEDKVAASKPAPPAQISLTDCLACSGCVTSAEAVLVSLQSQTEVLNTLDAYPCLPLPSVANASHNGTHASDDGRIYVASVSPQVRSSLAAVFGVSEKVAGNMIAQLLTGDDGLRKGGNHGSNFTWVVDTNTVREAALVLSADEVVSSLSGPSGEAFQPLQGTGSSTVKKPILASACPGWICYAEKTHPHVLPHLSRLKSPQALAGTLLKSVLSRAYNIPTSKIWHLAIMPCFDKKLEASRGELTDATWSTSSKDTTTEPVRDVDCVITARELLQLAESRGIDFSSLPQSRVQTPPFPDPTLDSFLFPRSGENQELGHSSQPLIPPRAAGTSGGFLAHILTTMAASYPAGSTDIQIKRGRNSDVVEFSLVRRDDAVVLARAARFYGFRNIQNLVRRLKPKKASRLPGAVTKRNGAATSNQVDYAYVEVMACPGGCTNGGGQIRAQEVAELRAASGTVEETQSKIETTAGPEEQRQWLSKVDEAYFSGSETVDSSEEESSGMEPMEVDGKDVRNNNIANVIPDLSKDASTINGISHSYIWSILRHWEAVTGVRLQDLVLTSFREVESDVGKSTHGSDMERAAAFAGAAGGGW